MTWARLQIWENAATAAVLPVTVQNSNIACLVLGTDIYGHTMVLSELIISGSRENL